MKKLSRWRQLFKRWITLSTAQTTFQCITQLVSLIPIRWIVIHRHLALEQLAPGGECVSWTQDLRNYQMMLKLVLTT